MSLITDPVIRSMVRAMLKAAAHGNFAAVRLHIRTIRASMGPTPF